MQGGAEQECSAAMVEVQEGDKLSLDVVLADFCRNYFKKDLL